MRIGELAERACTTAKTLRFYDEQGLLPPTERTPSGYLTSTTAMELTEAPESLLVLGGGYVALEQAQIFKGNASSFCHSV